MRHISIKNRGFTLLEILLVTVILAIVGLSVYSTFNNGIKLWKRIAHNTLQEDINIFFEKIAHDLRNSFQYTGIKFEGTEEKISFPTLITPLDEEIEDELGSVTYYLDNLTHSINREQASYSQLYQRITSPARELVHNIEDLTFQYYYYDPEMEKYSWKTVWKEEKNLPLAIRIKVKFHENGKENSFVETISIPVYKIPKTSEGK